MSTTTTTTVLGAAHDWYMDAVFYELHVRSYRDSGSDGMGDFRGLLEKLDYLSELGVTALWLLPFYPSPLRDDGYDISDYRQVHPSYGTLADFRRFLRAAHQRGLRVITELVLNHTSDEHPWFQRARRAAAGSVERDFYVWSDTSDRFKDARVIFKDFETSNWTFDPVPGAYYWHRFYSHQPNLNYDNPAVRKAMFDVVDFWLSMGVDGLRLDAVPYLYAREGTTSENLPETFAFLRQLRAHVDERFEGRMLLAEANQWPEDAVAYMGQGDACQMAFHFPLMPRMFMAARQEDRYPIVDILGETPATPPNCQWALFLRNHDELTLEMVTDEERDYMYRAYAQDTQARVNVGIRRRLAPLLGNNRPLIEMMNGLLFSLPGTPIVYYGDEIGMGDNIYLGDRNAVRTPMQWDSDRNAGFSSANPQRLFLPVIIDPEYHAQAINVEAQVENPNSLLWWMRRLISLRRRYQAFGRGSLVLLRPDNRKVLAFLRHYGEERILVVANLSRFTQCVELDLSELRGAVPVELFGNSRFPAVGDLPYFVTLGPHGFYWFSLEYPSDEPGPPRATLRVPGGIEELFDEPELRQLEAVLPAYIAERRWFGDKARTITGAGVTEVVPVPGPEPRAAPLGHLLLVELDLDQGSPQTYALSLAFATGNRAEELRRFHPGAICAEVVADGEAGVLYDALWSSDYARAIFAAIARRRQLPGRLGRLTGVPARAIRQFRPLVGTDVTPVPMSADQSNTSVAFSDRAIMKFIRRIEEGVNPGVEVARFLSERAHFRHSPVVGGYLEYRTDAPGAEGATIAALEGFVPNEGDGWSVVVDALGHGLEEALAHPRADELRIGPPPRLIDVVHAEPPSGHLLVGPHLEWASILGRRTAEMHLALTADRADPDFAPEPLTALERQSLYHGARSLTKRVFRQLAPFRATSPVVAEVLAREAEVGQRLRVLSATHFQAERIRCHGDFHLGQVLWTGRDFAIIDFEGEPARSLSQRRLKRPALVDVAGMVRSFHYASQAAALVVGRDLGTSLDPALESWLTGWYRWVSGTFLANYLEVAVKGSFLPSDDDHLEALLDFFLLEKAVYELGYEANTRPAWVDIPAHGVLDVLGPGAVRGPAVPPALAALADRMGVMTEYRSEGGTMRSADPEVLVAVLGLLGAEIDRPGGAAAALRAFTTRDEARQVEPVLVHWCARPGPLDLALAPDSAEGWLSIELDDGRVRRQPLAEAASAVGPGTGTGALVPHQVDPRSELLAHLPPGYHRLVVEAAGPPATALLLAAPRIPAARSGFGVFCPLNALRTEGDLGIGSYPALGELSRRTAGFGGQLVGTLPLYPLHPGPPAEGSPYRPLSRLAWNELYVDPRRLPELEISPESVQLLEAPEFLDHLETARCSQVVDFDSVDAVVHRLLDPMARALLATDSPRRRALAAFGAARPEMVEYARFRASLDPGPRSAEREGVHLYAQWVADQQLGDAAGVGGVGLYLDFPLGVHPDGFDPRWAPGSFAFGAGVGAAPDVAFPKGQHWGFPPLHPEGDRRDGYRYTMASLRHAFAYAGLLRLDHVMGLHRLWWIPDGLDPAHGAYVRYRAEELRAVVALEAARAGSAVVGEDLGTVPAGVRADMARDGMLRSWVFEFAATPTQPLPDPPAGAVASVATHDLPTFAGFWSGLDIDEAEARNLKTPARAAAARRRRAALRAALTRATAGAAGEVPVPAAARADPAAWTALVGTLRHLAAGPARLVMVDLADLWAERQPHNRPGTGAEALNWRRRATSSVDQLWEDDSVRGVLATLREGRSAPAHPEVAVSG